MTDPIVASALQAGFSDQFAESDVQLDVHGVIPPWVSGALVRNGPAQWTLPETGRFNHWFDGLAMLHRFSIRDGAVHYRNRWLDSRNRTSANRTGRNDYAQFDTDPKRSLWQKLTATLDFPLQFGNNDFITVARFGSDWVAVGETPTQIGIDIDDLSTKGPFEFKDRMFSIWTCSHMVPDPNRDRVYSFSTMGVPVFGRYHLWYVDGNTPAHALRDRQGPAPVMDAQLRGQRAVRSAHCLSAAVQHVAAVRQRVPRAAVHPHVHVAWRATHHLLPHRPRDRPGRP